MADLFGELLEVAACLEANGIEASLVGGLAYSIYVEPRATEDLDFLIRPDDWARCIEALRPLGWLNLAGPMDFEKIRIRRLTKLSREGALVCDFLLADGDYVRGVVERQAFRLMDQPIHLAPPEVIIELKKARMSEKDRGDIEGLERFLREREI